MEIRHRRIEYFDNVIYDFRIQGEVAPELKKLVAGYYVTPAQSFMPQTIWMRHLVVKCDPNNEFNPSQAEVKKNIAIVEALMAAGSVEVEK